LINNKHISILDCTLRDGGFALEDEIRYSNDVILFSVKEREQIADSLTQSNFEFIEVGAIEISKDDKTSFAIYQSVEDVSKILPKSNGISKFAALFRGPDTPVEQIPEHDETRIECLRVIIRYSELKKSMDFCAALAAKGYKTFVQPMVTLRYTEQELDYMIDASNDLGAYALYFVDSYGYMTSDDVRRLFDKYDNRLNKDICIGFHAHNNINLAFANIKDFLAIDTDRQIIADCTCLGMGQGAGNVQTELLIDYVNKNYGKHYDYDAVLNACELIETHNGQCLWGYSMPRILAAINHTAYKFAFALRRTYKLSYRDIHHILKNIPENLRHRYTQQNTIEEIA
jgi:4-hydroxy 2-oxovalerate aldolase